MQNKKYQIIYADPPWQYNRKAGQGIAADHYPTMSLQEICDLPVRKLADKDCVLFLWVTFPQLREGLSVIQAWGFQYKTVAFVWVKQNKKGGYFCFLVWDTGQEAMLKSVYLQRRVCS